MVAVTPSGAPVMVTESGPCVPRRSIESATFAEAPASIVTGAIAASCMPPGAVAAGCDAGAEGAPGAAGALGAAGAAAALDAAVPLSAAPPQPEIWITAKPEIAARASAAPREICRRDTTITPKRPRTKRSRRAERAAL